MEEQPVALAICSRSPKSCDRSFRYGVSPQPAHAPENSNSGSRNCTPRTLAKFTRVRSAQGSVSKKPMLSRPASRCSSRSFMLIALTSASSGLCAGQFSTHTPQPVQSSR